MQTGRHSGQRELHRPMGEIRDIRVELVLRDAQKMLEQKGPVVAKVFRLRGYCTMQEFREFMESTYILAGP